MNRDDVEWIVINGKPALVERPEWSVRRTSQLAASAERDRQRFNHRLRHPVTDRAA